jgi:serine phosphatase RsbU (regulator of sigma subunit)
MNTTGREMWGTAGRRAVGYRFLTALIAQLVLVGGLVLSAVFIPAANAQKPPSAPGEPGVYPLSLDSLVGESRSRTLSALWRYSRQDDAAFAAVEFDDSEWELINPAVWHPEFPPEWAGHGWFRLRLVIDETLSNRPLGVSISHAGAAEVFVNGELLYALGRPSPDPDQVETRLQRLPHITTLEAGEHVIAVRFSLNSSRAAQQFMMRGFRLIVSDPAAYARVVVHGTRMTTLFQFLFVGILGAFAVFHLLLFAFRRGALEHLWFGLLTAVMAAVSFFVMQFSFVETVEGLVNRLLWQSILAPLFGILVLRFSYGLFYERLPRIFWVFLAGGVAAAVLTVAVPRLTVVLFGYLIVISVETMRITVMAVLRRKPGAFVLGGGLLAVAVTLVYALLAELNALPNDLLGLLNPTTGVAVLVVTMSVWLSRQVARTNENLAEQLRHVQRLSEENLARERQSREDEVKRRLLEVEFRQKAEELEEARTLQLSMLPTVLPRAAGGKVTAYMTTATEVGGDYYDFHTGADGVLTLAIGDATGHGMRAGMMVTAVKSLFSTISDEEGLVDFLKRASRALKRMNLPRLYMSLTVARWDGRTLTVAGAGMPPVVVFRASTGEVEEFVHKTMPLGSFPDFPYRESSIDLGPGDVLVMMSDGLPERFNPGRDMFGYDRAVEAVRSAALGAPEAIITQLVSMADEWASGAPAEDDMTFVCLHLTPDEAHAGGSFSGDGSVEAETPATS